MLLNCTRNIKLLGCVIIPKYTASLYNETGTFLQS